MSGSVTSAFEGAGAAGAAHPGHQVTQQGADFFRNATDSGFLETHLHKNTGVGNSTFSFINIAR